MAGSGEEAVSLHNHKAGLLPVDEIVDRKVRERVGVSAKRLPASKAQEGGPLQIPRAAHAMR